MPLQKFFRKALARFQLRRQPSSAKHRPPPPRKLIHHPQRQRQLRTHHRQIRPHLLAQRNHRIQTLQVHRQALRLFRDAAIPRRAIKLRNPRRLPQLPHQRMLAPAVPRTRTFIARNSRLGAEPGTLSNPPQPHATDCPERTQLDHHCPLVLTEPTADRTSRHS